MKQMIDILIPYLTQLPVYFVWLVGIFLAITNRRKPRAVLIPVLIALGLFFVYSIMSRTMNTWLPLIMHERGWWLTRTSLLLTIIELIFSLVQAVAFGLILSAIFDNKEQKTK